MELKINSSSFRISLIFALLFAVIGFMMPAKSFANTYPANWSMHAMNSNIILYMKMEVILTLIGLSEFLTLFQIDDFMLDKILY
jgi:nitrate reductase gamma subunit